MTRTRREFRAEMREIEIFVGTDIAGAVRKVKPLFIAGAFFIYFCLF